MDFSLSWPHRLPSLLGNLELRVLICQLHLSVSQPNNELCYEFRDLNVKKLVNSNVAVILFFKTRQF